jgi:hypothetical protein
MAYQVCVRTDGCFASGPRNNVGAAGVVIIAEPEILNGTVDISRCTVAKNAERTERVVTRGQY